MVLEKDASTARQAARAFTAGLSLRCPNYANNLRSLGFGDDDLAGAGSDRLVDAVVAWGDLDRHRRSPTSCTSKPAQTMSAFRSSPLRVRFRSKSTASWPLRLLHSDQFSEQRQLPSDLAPRPGRMPEGWAHDSVSATDRVP